MSSTQGDFGLPTPFAPCLAYKHVSGQTDNNYAKRVRQKKECRAQTGHHQKIFNHEPILSFTMWLPIGLIIEHLIIVVILSNSRHNTPTPCASVRFNNEQDKPNDYRKPNKHNSHFAECLTIDERTNRYCRIEQTLLKTRNCLWTQLYTCHGAHSDGGRDGLNGGGAISMRPPHVAS